MASSVKLIYSGFATSATRVVYASNVTPSGKKNNSTQPLENGTAMARVQTQSYSNPMYNIGGIVVDLTNTSSLQYKDILALNSMKYDGTNAPKLVVTYNNTTSLTDLDGVTTQIPVILESWSWPIDVKDSRDGYRPTASLTFIGTR